MNREKKTVTILGSTGSVGINTLDVIRRNPSLFQVEGLAAASQTDRLQAQIKEFHPRAVYLKDPDRASALKSGGLKIFSEEKSGPGKGLAAFSSFLDSDILVACSSGTSALLAVLEAIERGRRVALANKEILVIAGAQVVSRLKANPSSSLLPVDSEHSAVFQCLEGRPAAQVEKIVLTSSGGPLREIPREDFETVGKDFVTNHPRWKMGKKISVDSATLMNKGLEVIEAGWLFGLPVNKIEVLIHPEAIIHSMVELRDGCVIAQLGVTDMRLPIQYALSYPDRIAVDDELRLDMATLGKLTFGQPDKVKFPLLGLAYEAARQSGSAPCVLSVADEVAVDAYLGDRIRFVQIPHVVETVLSRHRHVADPNLAEIQTIQSWAEEEARRLC